MKKIIFLSFLLFAATFVLTKQADAAGSFQLLGFRSSSTAVVNLPFKYVVNYIYSGDSVSHISLVGQTLPEGIELGSITYGANGVDSIEISGVPKKIGEYPLNLVITDNDGALLSQSFTIKVISSIYEIETESISNGCVGSQYSSSIKVDFLGETPSVNFDGLPEGIFYSKEVNKKESDGYPTGNVTVNLYGAPSKEGNYVVTFYVGNYNGGGTRKTFTINISSKTTETFSYVGVLESQNNNQNFSVIQNSKTISIFIDNEKEKVITIDKNLSNKLRGKILLQVESHGEAWYVNPKNSKKYYMANGDEAYNIMRNLGVGIKNSDLEKIQSNKSVAKKHNGKIFLQVESHGEAYYVNSDGVLYYLKDGDAAYEIMRSLGLGITNSDLRKIEVN